MLDWRRWVGPAGLMLGWSIVLAFVDKLSSFPVTIRGAVAIVATAIIVEWVALSLCPAKRTPPGFRPDVAAKPRDRWVLARNILVLAVVAGACSALALATLDFPSLIIVKASPKQYPGATQVEIRPPRTDTPTTFTMQVWTSQQVADTGELPCRCQDWNAAIRTTCEMSSWTRESLTLVVRELRHPARLGIWCDRFVELQLVKSPSSASVLYGISRRRWFWSFLATGGIACIIGSYLCWRHWRA